MISKEKIYYNYINEIGWSNRQQITTKKYIPPHLRKSGIEQSKEALDGKLNENHQDIIFPSSQYKNIKLNSPDSPCYNMRNIDKYVNCNYLEQIKGGNFISSPPTDFAPNGVVFYIEPITEEFKIILD